MSGIEWFEPRPPKVAALQLQPSWSLSESMEQLRQVPGVLKVAAERFGDDEIVYTVEPHKDCGKPIRFGVRSGGWLVAVVTSTTDADGYFDSRVDVKRISDHTFQRVYQPVVDCAALAKAALNAMAEMT